MILNAIIIVFASINSLPPQRRLQFFLNVCTEQHQDQQTFLSRLTAIWDIYCEHVVWSRKCNQFTDRMFMYCVNLPFILCRCWFGAFSCIWTADTPCRHQARSRSGWKRSIPMARIIFLLQLNDKYQLVMSFLHYLRHFSFGCYRDLF